MAHDKRSILITGCSDGSLGRHLAIAFHEAGWRVFASARNPTKAQEVTRAGLEFIQLDTLSQDSVSAAVDRVSKLTGGSLDMLLNNAGAGYSMPLLDLDWDHCKDLFELNFFSILTVTKAFLPLLRASCTVHGGTRGGIVVNNTSCAALWVGAMPFGGAYNASKGAAAQMTETLRLELAPFGIKVVNLLTGGVQSTFYDNAPKATLPSDSLFNIAKARVERAMSGVDVMAGNADPQTYAKQVAAKLSKPNPPHWVWAGKHSTTVWLATFLPVGTVDSVIKSLTGLDVVEKEIKVQEYRGT